jgi:hypothetical protein
MTSFLSTERIAIQALQEHTTHAVRLLAEHYGFDADEALTKVGLAPRPLPSLVAPVTADDPVLVITLQETPTDSYGNNNMQEQPMPSPSNDDDKPSKKQMAANQKKLGSRKQALQKRLAVKESKEAQKTAVKIMKAALKALKAFDKDAAKAVKEATRTHKRFLKEAEQAAHKTTRAALKALKGFTKQAQKSAKAKSPKKSPLRQKTQSEATATAVTGCDLPCMSNGDTSTPKPRTACVFPFIYQGKTYATWDDARAAMPTTTIWRPHTPTR